MKYPHAVLFFKAPQLFLVKTRHSGPEWTRQCRGKKKMPILSKGSEWMIDLHWYMLRFQYFKRFCYDTYVVQYSLGHCSLEVELKAAGNGHSERLERQNTQKKNGAIGLALVGDGEGRKCPRQFCSCWLPWHRIMFLVLLKVAADGYTMSCHLLLCALATILMNLYIQDMRCNYHFYPIIKALRRMTIHKGVILHEPADKGNDNNRRLKYESKWEWCFGLCQP